MAEVLAIASGIAGLLSLTIEVSRISSTYVKGVKSASESAKGLLQELKVLKQVLFELDNLVAVDDEDIFPVGPSRLRVQDFEECRKLLEKLRGDLLERLTGNSISVKLKALSWPFSEGRTQQMMANLHQHLAIFQNALNIDT